MRAAEKRRAAFSSIVLVFGALYFFLPLVATFLFSLRGKKGVLSFAAYGRVLADPQFLKTFLFSLEMAVCTIAFGLVLIVPTAIWIHLRVPKAKTLMESLSLMPFVIPPIILAFGLIKTYSKPPFALVSSPALLVAGYVVICFPYMYRSVDSGLRAMDLRLLSEAAQSLGAGWASLLFRVALPSLRPAILSAVFLCFATVIGELTLAVLLAWPAFGPYMALVGRDLAYEPAALAIMSFALTWGAIGLMQFLAGRASRAGIQARARDASPFSAAAAQGES
jgi:ABC-type spermidine/putrescine transport system, permease component II